MGSCLGNVIFCQIFREVKESLERGGEQKFSLAGGGGHRSQGGGF